LLGWFAVRKKREKTVSVSSVSAKPVVTPPPSPPQPQVKRAADGDTAAQEAAETNAAKRAEKANGGFTPKIDVKA
jgi:hypothetical protein